jgi:cysteine desulfurase
VAPITANFTSESPLSPAVQEAIASALEQGWADPKKISQASHRAQLLRSSALEELAAHLGVRPTQIEVCGEPNLLAYLAIAGLAHLGLPFATTAVDIGKVRAVARSYQGEQTSLPVSSLGEVNLSSLPPTSLLTWQSVNGETGARHDRLPEGASLIYDASADLPHRIPDGVSTAFFNARSWQGPAGVGFLVIADSQKYQYPLPHIAPIHTPGSYSLPLLIGSVVAANERAQEDFHITEHRLRLISALEKVPYLQIVDAVGAESSPQISLLVDGISNQEFMSALSRNGIDVDAGSACSPEDIAPSHVIEAMGFPTNGHIRLTLRNSHTALEIDQCAQVIKETINQLRS